MPGDDLRGPEPDPMHVVAGNPPLTDDVDPGPAEHYRVTLLYADDVIPPLVAGEVARRTQHYTRDTADAAVEIAVGRTDIGRIMMEERLRNDVTTRQDEWRVMHSWTRTANDGWWHQ